MTTVITINLDFIGQKQIAMLKIEVSTEWYLPELINVD